MDEERYLILKMLEEGKITAEEAAALLGALGESGDSGDAGAGGSGPGGEPGGGSAFPDWECRGRRAHRPPRPPRPPKSCRHPRDWGFFDREGFDRAMEEMRRDLEKIRLGAMEIGDEVSRRFHDSLEGSEWRRGGPRQFRHFIRNIGDVFSIPFGREMYEETFEEEVDAPADAWVCVRDLSGDVKVETWDRDAVRVEARKRVWAGSREEAKERAADYKMRVERQGNEIHIGADLSDDAPGWLPARCTIDYDVRVPAGSHLKAVVTNGDVDVAGVRGGLEVRNTNGEIRARNVAGAVAAGNTNGDIDLRGVEAEEINVKTVNGDIDLDLASLGAGNHGISTARGDVTVTLDPGARVDLLASTMHGEISLSLPASVVSRSSTRLEARLGGLAEREGQRAGSEGVPEIEIRTLFGDVSLVARKEGSQ